MFTVHKGIRDAFFFRNSERTHFMMEAYLVGRLYLHRQITLGD